MMKETEQQWRYVFSRDRCILNSRGCWCFNHNLYRFVNVSLCDLDCYSLPLDVLFGFPYDF